MKPMKIGQRDTAHLKYLLRRSEENLNEIITSESLAEFGLSCDTDTVKDILSGGNTSRLKLLDAIEKEVSRSDIPMIQGQIRENLQPLIRQFDEFVSKAKGAVDYELRGLRLIDYLEATGMQIWFTEGAQTTIDEHCSIYINTEEQVKILKAANEVSDALNNLQKLVEPFGLNAWGTKGVIQNDMTVDIEALPYCKPDGLFAPR
jgi:hypothetical protein